MAIANLTFSLGPARDWDDLVDVCRVRAQSYGHHVDSMRTSMLQPDDIDLMPTTAVFLCRDKASGTPVGTARVQVSLRGPLLIDGSVTLPDDMQTQSRAEITRLSAVPGADPLVKLALMKAGYLYCLANQTRWLVIGARNDALIRQYRRLGFSDLQDGGQSVPLDYAGGLPHRILRFDVTGAERAWSAMSHPLYPFMVETVHPDIQLFRQERIARPMTALAMALAMAD